MKKGQVSDMLNVTIKIFFTLIIFSTLFYIGCNFFNKNEFTNVIDDKIKFLLSDDADMVESLKSGCIYPMNFFDEEALIFFSKNDKELTVPKGFYIDDERREGDKLYKPVNSEKNNLMCVCSDLILSSTTCQRSIACTSTDYNVAFKKNFDGLVLEGVISDQEVSNFFSSKIGFGEVEEKGVLLQIKDDFQSYFLKNKEYFKIYNYYFYMKLNGNTLEISPVVYLPETKIDDFLKNNDFCSD